MLTCSLIQSIHTCCMRRWTRSVALKISWKRFKLWLWRKIIHRIRSRTEMRSRKSLTYACSPSPSICSKVSYLKRSRTRNWACSRRSSPWIFHRAACPQEPTDTKKNSLACQPRRAASKSAPLTRRNRCRTKSSLASWPRCTSSKMFWSRIAPLMAVATMLWAPFNRMLAVAPIQHHKVTQKMVPY